MKFKLLFLCIIFFTTENNAMKRLKDTQHHMQLRKRRTIDYKQLIMDKSFPYTTLPLDMQNVIINFTTINTIATEVK